MLLALVECYVCISIDKVISIRAVIYGCARRFTILLLLYKRVNNICNFIISNKIKSNDLISHAQRCINYFFFIFVKLLNGPIMVAIFLVEHVTRRNILIKSVH